SIALPALVALPTLSLAGGLFGGDYLPLSLTPASGRQGAVNVEMMFVGAVWLAIFAGLAIIAEKNHWFWWLLGFEVVVLALLHPLLLHGIRASPRASTGTPGPSWAARRGRTPGRTIARSPPAPPSPTR